MGKAELRNTVKEGKVIIKIWKVSTNIQVYIKFHHEHKKPVGILNIITKIINK